MSDERISARLRAQVVERARECCEYCRSQARFAMQAFSVMWVFAEEAAPLLQTRPFAGIRSKVVPVVSVP